MAIFSKEQLYSWGKKALTSVGMPGNYCADILDVLVESNLRGVDTHGIIRAIDYAKRYQQSACGELIVEKETPALTLVNGNNLPGPVCGVFAMKKAIEKAKQVGCAVSTVYGSNHFSTAAYYSMMAAKENMIGLSMTNSSPRIAPWGGLEAVVGNNPWSFTVPGRDMPITLDMANTVINAGKIRTYLRDGKELEPGWAMDSEGYPTTDPAKAINGLLMTIGGYKGVGISMMVDILCGASSGAGVFSNNIKRVEDYDQAGGVSHLFVAIDIGQLVDIEKFKDDVAGYVDTMKSVRRRSDVKEIFLPGEIEWKKMQNNMENGINLSDSTVEKLNKFADEMNIPKLG